MQPEFRSDSLYAGVNLQSKRQMDKWTAMKRYRVAAKQFGLK